MDNDTEKEEKPAAKLPENFCDEQGNPLVDSTGSTFNPEIHLFDKDEAGVITPRTTIKGKLRKSQKKKSAVQKQKAEKVKSQMDEEEREQLEVFQKEARAEAEAEEREQRGKKQGKPVAKALVGAMKKTLKAVVGGDAGKLDNEEQEILEDSAEDMIKEKGGIAFSGTKLFVFFTILFFVPKLIQMAVDGDFKGLVGKFKDRKKGMSPADETIIDVVPS